MIEIYNLENEYCVNCERPINPKEFVDDESIREFMISGLCQYCQDITFKK